MKFLILLALPLMHCGIIPDTDQDSSNFHQCLLSYIAANNISSDLSATRHNEEREDCSLLHEAIVETISAIYKDVEKNLNEILENKTEVDCLMESFRFNKFLEINIVLTAAHLTTGANDEHRLEEVFSKSKEIFTIATMKCVMSDQMLMEIFQDFSLKVHVSQEELECVKMHLRQSNEPEETTSFATDTFLTDTSDEVTVESTTVEDLTTFNPADIELGVETFVQGNQIFKLSSEASSVEESRSTLEEICANRLKDVRARITNFQFPSMNDEQNLCMTKQVTENDVTAVYHFIALRNSSKTIQETNERNENLKSLLIGYIWNVIECFDVFGFTDMIDNLLPRIKT